MGLERGSPLYNSFSLTACFTCNQLETKIEIKCCCYEGLIFVKLAERFAVIYSWMSELNPSTQRLLYIL